jgi:hypothetical protein
VPLTHTQVPGFEAWVSQESGSATEVGAEAPGVAAPYPASGMPSSVSDLHAWHAGTLSATSARRAASSDTPWASRPIPQDPTCALVAARPAPGLRWMR